MPMLTYQGQVVNQRIKKELVYQLLEKQDGRCAICPNLLYSPCLDHDHETGEIRGALCDTCNRGLGYFYDNPTYLARAIEYLTGVEINVPDPS